MRSRAKLRVENGAPEFVHFSAMGLGFDFANRTKLNLQLVNFVYNQEL
jgi:hypothetical protein